MAGEHQKEGYILERATAFGLDLIWKQLSENVLVILMLDDKKVHYCYFLSA